jgi:hypothetical protein
VEFVLIRGCLSIFVLEKGAFILQLQCTREAWDFSSAGRIELRLQRVRMHNNPSTPRKMIIKSLADRIS